MAENNLIATVSGGLLKTDCLKGFSGFTLAEVLITLVIIGVIAAMTIPTLINKTNNQEYVSRLKKIYSTFAQVTNQIIAENGTPDNWNLKGTGSYNEASEKFGKLYQKYLSNAKQCTASQRGCFPASNGVYKDWKGNDISFIHDNISYYRLILSDGAAVIFDGNIHDDCNSGSGIGQCGYFTVDVNGSKGPNIVGRDTFVFLLTKDGLRPCGYNNNGVSPTTACNNLGTNCTWKVLLENAMNY